MSSDSCPLDDGVSSAAVIVAHPDDETLWAGGMILSHPEVNWHVVALTRAGDPDRAPRYLAALARLGASGRMADLDDGPDQMPLDERLLERTIVGLLPPVGLDLLLTHGPAGEYTRHRRHEEVCRAVVSLWRIGRAQAGSLWLFAYGDSGPGSLPRPEADADIHCLLPTDVWERKAEIIRGVYGFAPSSWEARSTPREEAFWRFSSPEAVSRWLSTREAQR